MPFPLLFMRLNMKSKLLIPFALLMVCSVISCEKLVFEKEMDTPTGNFEMLWKFVNEHYPMFREKEIDWGQIHEHYRSQVSNSMSDEALFNVLANMLNELKDGHVNLYSPFKSSFYDINISGFNNFDPEFIQTNYLGSSYYKKNSVSAALINQVLYIGIGDFSSSLKEPIRYLYDTYATSVQGIIIDVRNNGGGNRKNAMDLAATLTNKSAVAGVLKYKNGPGANNFTDLLYEYIQPDPEHYWNTDVVILVNRSTYSATNSFVAMCKPMEHVTVMGDTTGGGGAELTDGELPNGWIYRIPTAVYYGPGLEFIENGVAPEVYVGGNTIDQVNLVDSMIEKALLKLK